MKPEVCPATRKIRYKTGVQAQAAIEAMARKGVGCTSGQVHGRFYRCEHCRDLHLTHSPHRRAA